MPARPRVLLLESDPSVKDSVVPALEGLPASVSPASSVSDALRLGPSFDAALISAALPDGNGFQVCKRLLAGEKPSVVLFTMERTAFPERIAAFAAGAADYISKWSSPEEFRARLRFHLGGPVPPDAAPTAARTAETQERARQDLEDFIIHDVKTPLRSVKATLAMLQESRALPSHALGRSLEIYDHASIVMLMRINDLLDLERFAGRGMPSLPAVVDLESLLSRVKELLEARLKPAGTTFLTRLVPPLAFARSDYQMLFRALVNLADNAFRRSRPDQEVAALVKLGEGFLRLSVADRGPAVPDAEKPRAFDRARGAEAGLAYCRAAAATLGGRVWVEDRPGGGGVFALEVPAEKVNAA